MTLDDLPGSFAVLVVWDTVVMSSKLLAVLALLTPACGDTSTAADRDAASSLDASLSEDASASSERWLPAPPTADEFGWQGVQSHLVALAAGPGCKRADIALAMWQRAVCYVAVGGELMCAGQIGETVFGASFVPAGIDGVVQLLGSPTFNSDVGSAACSRKSDGTAWCLGYGTGWGQFRTADGLDPGPTWTQWGNRDDITELATGTMDSICARYADRTVDCVGFTCGLAGEPQECRSAVDAPTPITLGSNVQRVWIDTSGQVHLDEAQVFRTGNSRSSCSVVPEGLVCSEPPEVVMPLELSGASSTSLGIVVADSGDSGGKVVDGNAASIASICWLTASGEIWCRESDPILAGPEDIPATTEYFPGLRAVALAINGYSRDLDRCVAVDDGSLWCIGGNMEGKLGAGTTAPLLTETQVQPPGSVRINCAGGP